MQEEEPRITPQAIPDPEGPESAAEVLEDNWMAGVVAEHKRETSVVELHMGFPSWGDPDFPTLVVTFGVLERQVVEKFQREARKAAREAGNSPLNAEISFLCNAARKVWIRRPDTDKLVQVKDGDGTPVRLEKKLGEMLKLPDEHNKNTHVRMMYLADDNGIALGAWAMQVAQWMTNTSATIAGAIVERELVKGN